MPSSEHWHGSAGDLEPLSLHFGPASDLVVSGIRYFGLLALYAAMRRTPPETYSNKFIRALIFLICRNHHVDLGILSSLTIGNGNFCSVSSLLAYLVLRIFPIAGLGESFFCSCHVENLVLTFPRVLKWEHKSLLHHLVLK